MSPSITLMSMKAEPTKWVAAAFYQSRRGLAMALLLGTLASPFQAQAQRGDGDGIRYITPGPTPPPSPTPPATPTRPFEVNPADVRRPGAPLKQNKVKPFDKAKVKSIFDKANSNSESRKKPASDSVSTQSATGTSSKSGSTKKAPPADRLPTIPPQQVPTPESDTNNGDEQDDQIQESKIALPTSVAPVIGKTNLAPEFEIRTLDPRIYQEMPERPSVELPKGGTELPGTGLPGQGGIGGLRGGFQGGLERPALDENTGEEHYNQDFTPGGYNPATDPSGSLGDAGGYLGAAGQAYGGKTGRTMEQFGGVMQSGSLGQAAGRGADILLPGSGGFVEAAANGDRTGMVNAGANAAGSLASDLVIGLLIGFAGGGLIGMAVGYALSATGAGRAIADGVSAGIKWIAEKVGVTGSEPAPPPEPEPPSPNPESYDENYSKGNGKKGPSVINENQVRPLQDKMNRDLLGEKRDGGGFVDTSDTPAPGRVAVGAGCDLDGAVAKANGSINLKDPLTVKDMEKPGYDKY